MNFPGPYQNINFTPNAFQYEQRQALISQADRYNQLKDSIKYILKNPLIVTPSGCDFALDALVKLLTDYPDYFQKVINATAKLMRKWGGFQQQQIPLDGTVSQSLTQNLKRKPDATIHEEGATKRIKKLNSPSIQRFDALYNNGQIQPVIINQKNLKVIKFTANELDSAEDYSETEEESEEILPSLINSNTSDGDDDYRISAEVWKKIQPMIPIIENSRSQGWYDKLSLEGICWLVRNSSSWLKIPKKYGSWKRIYKFYHHLKNTGALNEISSLLEQIPKATNCKSLYHKTYDRAWNKSQRPQIASHYIT